MKHITSRLLALLLTVAMIISMMPAVYAADKDVTIVENKQPTVEETIVGNSTEDTTVEPAKAVEANFSEGTTEGATANSIDLATFVAWLAENGYSVDGASYTDTNAVVDGKLVVKWSPVSGCLGNNCTQEHAGIEHDSVATNRNVPNKVNSDLAQFYIANNGESTTSATVSISNVKFQYVPADFRLYGNTGNATSATADGVRSGQLYFLNSGNSTFEDCEFDQVVLTTFGATGTTVVRDCRFANVYNSYAIKDIRGENISVTDTTIENCGGGIMVSSTGTVSDVTITGNTFTNVDVDGTAASNKVGTRAILQIASSGTYTGTTFDFSSNTASNCGPVVRQLNDGVTFDTEDKNALKSLVSEGGASGYQTDDSKTPATPTGKAAIGSTGYDSLAAAVKEAKAGDTIVLLDNITITSKQKISKQLTLDLNGKTLTGTADRTIELTSTGDLTVKDSIGGGKIANSYGGSYPRTVYLYGAGAVLTLESGTIESTPNLTDLQSVAISSEKDKACTVNIKGGSVVVPETATEGRSIVASTRSMTLNISGGTITGGLCGVDAYSGSTVNITGGTVSATYVDTGVVREAFGMRIIGTANVTIDGGEITGVKMDDTGYKLDVPNVTLKSGTVNGSFYSITKGTIMFTVDENATIKLANASAQKFLPSTVELAQNEDGTYGVTSAKVYYAAIGEAKYDTLANAIAAAKDGETVTLLADCSGDGIQIAVGKFSNNGLTIDFAGHTYTVDGTTVGSPNSTTNGFQLLKGNKIAMKNGTLYSGKAYILIQNYSSLTLEKMTLDGKDIPKHADYPDRIVRYTLSNNCGDIVIEDSTITAPAVLGVAFDACGYSEYTGVSVTVKGNSTINGDIEVSRSATNTNDVKLALEGGTINGTLKIDSSIKPGDATTITKSNSVTIDAPEGYKWVDGTLTSAYVAEVNGVKYETLQAAIDAATRNATVTMLADTCENVTISTPYVTLDLKGHTLNGSTGERKPALTITARVTVKDSSAAQTGTIMREDTAENSGVSSHYVIDVQGAGWLTFESGTVKNGSGAGGTKGASLVRVGDDSVAKYPGLNIKGGTFTQDNFIVIKVDRGDLFLNGGTLNSANSYAVENWHRATIKGGTVNGDVASWTYSGGLNSNLTISGGTVNGDVTSVNYGNADKVAKVAITGGTVTGNLDTRSYDPTTGDLTSITDPAKATIEITGGTFSSNPSEYVV